MATRSVPVQGWGLAFGVLAVPCRSCATLHIDPIPSLRLPFLLAASNTERRLLELKEAQKEAEALDLYREKLERERADLNARGKALDAQLDEIAWKSRKLL